MLRAMTVAELQIGLFVSLGITVVILVTAMWLDHKHKTKPHIAMICVFLPCFLVTVGFADALGLRYDFPTAPLAIHLTLAITASLGTLAPLITGSLHWRGGEKRVRRVTHRNIALGWFGLVVLALLTGGYMLTTGTLKPDPEDQETGLPAQGE